MVLTAKAPGAGAAPGFVPQTAPPPLRVVHAEAADAAATSTDGVRDLEARLGAYLRRGRARVVLTDNLRTMVSIKRSRGHVTLRLHRMFLDASPAVVRALARYADDQDRPAAIVLRAHVEAHAHTIRMPTSRRAVPLDPVGRFHDLQRAFERVNLRYFEGRIQARITWGPRNRRPRGRTSIKLGSYAIEERLIRVHPVLDAADVPEWFVDWVVYHEMLHDVHDIPVVDGRRVFHTPEFRRAEAAFERYTEAVLWERTHLGRLLDR